MIYISKRAILSRKFPTIISTMRCSRIHHVPSPFFRKRRTCIIPVGGYHYLPYFVEYSWIGISVGKPAISFIKSNWMRVGGFVESNYMLMARFAWRPSFVSQSARAELAFGLTFWWRMSVPALDRLSFLAWSRQACLLQNSRRRQDCYGSDGPFNPIDTVPRWSYCTRGKEFFLFQNLYTMLHSKCSHYLKDLKDLIPSVSLSK